MDLEPLCRPPAFAVSKRRKWGLVNLTAEGIRPDDVIRKQTRKISVTKLRLGYCDWVGDPAQTRHNTGKRPDSRTLPVSKPESFIFYNRTTYSYSVLILAYIGSSARPRDSAPRYWR